MLTPYDPDELQTRHDDRSCDLNVVFQFAVQLRYCCSGIDFKRIKLIKIKGIYIKMYKNETAYYKKVI